MSRVFDAVMTWFFDIVNSFGNLRHQRHDDPLLTEYKAKKRAALWSFAPFFLVLVVSWAAGTVLNVIERLPGAEGSAAVPREWLLLGFYAAASLATFYALLTWVALYRFTQKNQIE